MKLLKSKTGLTLSFLYLGISIFLIISQGLFGESFIAVILGLPWSFLIVYFKLFTISQHHPLFLLFLYIETLGPIIVNIILFYWIGVGVEKLFSRSKFVEKN